MLALCTVLGGIPAVAADATEAPVTEEKPAEITVIVAAKDIPEGTYITDDYLTTVTVPNINIPANVNTELDQVMTKYAKAFVAAGEYVSTDAISSQKINKVNNDLLVQDIQECPDKYLVVTDYVLPNTGKDLTALLQQIIDKNPKRTIYFPDGEYVIASSLVTDSTPTTTVSIQLSDGAVLKASDKWKGSNGAYLICSGADQKENDIDAIGTYFSVIGGTLDGNGKANGIQIVSGRETLFRNLCIKNVDIGIRIERGLNGGSSDDDFEDISIYGTGNEGSIGISIKGHDNTFTNIRIYNMEMGIYSDAGSSLYKNISIYGSGAAGTVGIRATSWAWLSQCYVQDCATAYSFKDNRSIICDSVASWSSDDCTTQTAFSFDNSVGIALSGIRAEFSGTAPETAFIKARTFGNTAVMEACMFDPELEDSGEAYINNIKTPIIPIS